jgi:hypothetical protein
MSGAESLANMASDNVLANIDWDVSITINEKKGVSCIVAKMLNLCRQSTY